MNFGNQFNVKSPAVKRLMREASEMSDPTEDCSAAPVNDNLFEWHFTIRGAPETDFEGGIYHGRLIFPSEYPMKPPNIVLLTPNGRFETNKKICLSISGHHPETWQPSWCVRTALMALIAFMPTSGTGTVGSLDYSPDERRLLAKKSQDWKCTDCGKISDLLQSTDNTQISSKTLDDDEKAVQQSDQIIDNQSNQVPEKETACSSKDDAFTETPPSTNIQNQFSNSNGYSGDVPHSVPSHQHVNPNPMIPEDPPLLNTSFFSYAFSNLSNSRITVSVIVILIALLLYRRIFLIEHN